MILYDFPAKCSQNAFIFILLFVRLHDFFFVTSRVASHFFDLRFKNWTLFLCSVPHILPYSLLFAKIMHSTVRDQFLFLSVEFFSSNFFLVFLLLCTLFVCILFQFVLLLCVATWRGILNTYATIAHLNMSDDSHFGALFQNTLGFFCAADRLLHFHGGFFFQPRLSSSPSDTMLWIYFRLIRLVLLWNECFLCQCRNQASTCLMPSTSYYVCLSFAFSSLASLLP